ncbi:MAG TPA: DUF454 domain-containing protein [Thermoplasmata archaeon]|nr:DUF454 domain-containing protein [Thermoplasmata archaeon]
MNDNKEEAGEYHTNEIKIVSNRFLKGLLMIVGHISVGLGVIGIFVPLLPTTPFLLLAAWCYSRSSKKFHVWLLNNKWFGHYIRNYLEGRGIPLKAKVYTLSLLWATILLTIFFLIQNLLVVLILILIVSGVTLHIYFIPTLKQKEKN